MRFLFIVCTFLFFQGHLFSQKKWSIGLDIGTTIGLSKFTPTEGFSPYFDAHTEPDIAYGLSIKYFIKEEALLEFTVSDYIRFVGARIQTVTDNGGLTNESLNADVSALYIFNYHKRIVETKKNRFNVWLFGGIGLEQIKDRFLPLGGFPELILTSYETKEGTYPRLSFGVTAKHNIGKSILGFKLVGGIGFLYHTYYFYEGFSDGVVYNGVVQYKGDYLGLLVTYEYGFNKRKVKNKKGKRKRRKRR